MNPPTAINTTVTSAAGNAWRTPWRHTAKTASMSHNEAIRNQMEDRRMLYGA